MISHFAKAFSVVLAAIVISKSYVDFRSRKESAQMFLLWTLTWVAIVLVALFPSMIDVLIGVGGGRAGIGTFLGMAIVFNLFLVYRTYVRMEALEQKVTVVVQELALRDRWESPTASGAAREADRPATEKP